MNIIIVIALLIIISLLISYKNQLDKGIEEKGNYKWKVNKLYKKHKQEVQAATKQALTSSRNAFKRELSEVFCPFQDGFSYNARDCIFVGNPIDYVIFNNLEAYREGKKDIDDIEIVFFEVKSTCSAHMSKVQKAIEYTFLTEKVKFEIYQDLASSQNAFKKS